MSDQERDDALRREAEEIAQRRDDAILAQPSAAAKLVDCEVCAGTGAMTCRPADQPDALPALIPCPACAGRGALLHRTTAGAPRA